MARQQLEEYFNLEPPKLQLYQITKNLAANIAPCVYSTFRDLGVICDKSILSANMICQTKKIYHLNKEHAEMATPAVE